MDDKHYDGPPLPPSQEGLDHLENGQARGDDSAFKEVIRSLGNVSILSDRQRNGTKRYLSTRIAEQEADSKTDEQWNQYPVSEQRGADGKPSSAQSSTDERYIATGSPLGSFVYMALTRSNFAQRMREKRAERRHR